MIIFSATVFLTILLLCFLMANSLLSQIDFTSRVTKVRKALINEGMPNPMLTKLKRIKFLKKIDFLLFRAGFRSNTALVKYVSICLISPIIFASGLLFFGILKHYPEWANISLFIIGCIFGLNLPFFLLRRTTRARQSRIQQNLSDIVAVLSMYIDSGYTLNNALRNTAKDLQYYMPEITQEFSLTASELEVTNDYHDVWQALLKRVNLNELQMLATALEQSYKYGVSLKNILHNLISQLSRERMVKLEERGARIPVFMVLVLIFCFMPIMFTIILTPLIFRSIDAFKMLF
jgi:tight adherence protein C